jgi:predicted anti-sigma-YlaC factor YlaD
MSETNTITCEEALRLLAELLDGELEGTHGREVEGHLARCRSCYSRAEFERRLKSQVGTLREQPVPLTFEQRIRALIGQFAAASEVPPRGD